MGRRSRKRAASPVAPSAHPAPQAPAHAPPSAPRAATYKSRREDAPKPAWAPVPLTEVCILLAIILLIVGMSSHGDRRGATLGGGIVLITLAAGELSLREHFAGYRSHSALLAAICAILAAIPVYLLAVPQAVVLGVAAIVFGAAFVALRNAFKRRSGGVGFRV